LNHQLYLPDRWSVKDFFGLLFVIFFRRGIFFHKTDLREKLKDSQRVKSSYFAFSFLKSQMKLFSKQECVMFLNPILFLKKQIKTLLLKNHQFFLASKTSIFLVLEELRNLIPQIIVRVKLREREIGRKAIFQSFWL